MQTFKYIVKRILLSILILFGVSIIIYLLSRMMPTDFIDQQYAGALQNGTMTRADVERIKEIYGLSMPDAFLSVTPGEGSDFAGVKFTKKTTQDDKESIDIYKITDDDGNLIEGQWEEIDRLTREWLADSYEYKDKRIYLYNTGDLAGMYEIYTVKELGGVKKEDVEDDKKDEVGSDDKEDDGSVIILNEELTLKERGRYYVDIGDGKGEPKLSMSVAVLDDNGEVSEYKEPKEAALQYRVASFWNKAGSMFVGYFTWLGNMLKGDLGTSFKYKAPVGEVIVKNMGISFGIALVATILQFAIAIPLGIKAATNQYGVIDYTVTVFAMIGISLPTFFLAALFIRLFAVQFGWFPVGGAIDSLPVGTPWIVRAGNVLWHMVLPMTVLVILSIGGLMRYTRTNTLEVLNADYIRTARAKGLSERTVVYKHAFRNTMIPLVTMLAGTLPSLFGGAMITETVFSIPGIGKLAYDALMVADVPFIMGYNMFIAILTVVGTLLSDLMYAVVDPRVKLGR